MFKIILQSFFILIFFLNSSVANAQEPSANLPHYNVAIFAPLYLDSVFNDEGKYKYGKSFPKFAVQGLDFIQGAQIALDSLPLYGGNINAFFYDSKSGEEPVDELIRSKKLDSIDLIIGSVKDEEFRLLADFAKTKTIPFISATYPNDGGIETNPFVVIVNSTLKAHCESIFSYLLQNHSADKIFLVRRPGSQEDKVAEYFRSINSPDGKPLLNIQTINISDDFSVLKSKLDSTKQNIIIGGSLNEPFALKLATAAYGINKKYKNTIIGMPNWDGFGFISKKNSFKDYPIYYTSPYFNYKYDAQSKLIQNVYKRKYKGIPSDMTYKGYETVFVFARLLTRFPNDYISHLNEYPYKVFSEYRFKPVHASSKTIPDYFENKRLYFIKVMNGTVSKASF